MTDLLQMNWPFAAVCIAITLALVIAYGIRKGG